MSADVERVVTAWLKHDTWTRKEALLILSGFHPDTPIDSANNPLPNHELYLDGSRQFHMNQIHPRNIEFVMNYLNLYSYCDPDDMINGNLSHCTKKLKPSEWIEWAKSKGYTPYWLQESEYWSQESKLVTVVETGRRQEQFKIISEIINQLGYEKLAIPDGGKAKIKALCLKKAGLFTMSGFDHAWKDGVHAELFKMKNHAKYTSAKCRQ